jgi:hypothetical protein
MPADRPLVSVVIVSFNTRQMTLNCLRSLQSDLRSSSTIAEIWVVDNASTDQSVLAIREKFPSVKVIEQDRNLGFGAANNAALCRANGEFLLLLNSDAFVKPGAVSALVRYLQEHPAAGAVGPRLLNADGSLQRSCHTFPSPARSWLENLGISFLLSNHKTIGDYRRWDHASDRDVDFVIGACLMVRRSVYEQVGGFDERFFMYSEETDWQRRIHAAGWSVAFTSSATVTHLGGGSGAANTAGPKQPWRVSDTFLQSLDYYQIKHHGLLGLISFRAAMTVGAIVRALAWAGMLVFPGRRAAAWDRFRKYADLAIRQPTRWRLPVRESHSSPDAKKSATMPAMPVAAEGGLDG